MSTAQREFIVTLKHIDFLEEFYRDMEGGGAKACVPSREVRCVYKRPVSRNTHYLLTESEAQLLRDDPRVESISSKLKGISTKTNLFSSQTGVWSRGEPIAVGQKNWGLYRCQLEDNLPQWGSGSDTNDVAATINFNTTGKNVDIIIVDEIAYANHVEFNGRMAQYDWFGEHDLAVRGAGSLISAVERSAGIARLTTQSAHGIEAGMIINVTCNTNASFNVTNATVIDVSATPVESGGDGITINRFRYENVANDVSLTNATGSWVGKYQYDNFSNINNHATHVAAIIGGVTQGWAKESNLYNLRHDASGMGAGLYTPPELVMDYVRQFHATKAINPATGRKNPTLVNNSWGLGIDIHSSTNPYTGDGLNTTISKINYRGNLITSSQASVDTGYSGICNANTKIASLITTSNGGNRITTSGSAAGSVASLNTTLIGASSLIDLGEPTGFNAVGTVDSHDDAIWQIQLPFNIQYMGGTYGPSGTESTYININSNSYVTFGGGFTYDYFVGAAKPTVRKIFASSGDRNCKAVYANVFGNSPNRTFTVRWEGWEGANGGIQDPTGSITWEMTFYEGTPNQIDLVFGNNASYRGEFTVDELSTYGINITGPEVPYRSAAMDADIIDAINDGIVFVGAAGNSNTKIATVSDISSDDYNNYFISNGFLIYYNRGSSPSASHPDIICVGEVDSVKQEYKSQTSNSGPRVDLYAPGTNIISAVYDGFGSTTGVVNDGSPTAQIQSVSYNETAAEITITTAQPHGFSNGNEISIADCTLSYLTLDYGFIAKAFHVPITLISPTSFSFTTTNFGTGDIPTTAAVGTVLTNFLYQKQSGTSMASAQVTGVLALILETYPWMTQSQAKEYILRYAKLDKMSFDNAALSLNGGSNAFLFYHKDRVDIGPVYPSLTNWLRPSAGSVYPRARIKRT